jgi:hypothetical protein
VHLTKVIDHFQLTDGRFLGIPRVNASTKYSKAHELQSTIDDAGTVWPQLKNHIPYIAHIIQLALGAFMSSLGVKDHTKSLEVHVRDQQFGENGSIDIGKS